MPLSAIRARRGKAAVRFGTCDWVTPRSRHISAPEDGPWGRRSSRRALQTGAPVGDGVRCCLRLGARDERCSALRGGRVPHVAPCRLTLASGWRVQRGSPGGWRLATGAGGGFSCFSSRSSRCCGIGFPGPQRQRSVSSSAADIDVLDWRRAGHSNCVRNVNSDD